MGRGSRLQNVAASTVAINPGEPVTRLAGGTTVVKLLTNAPSIGVANDLVVGVAQTTSTNTSSAAGTVQIIPSTPQTTWLISANSATQYDTQTEYDALVGKRVLLDYTNSTYTILATDATSNGCIIQPLDVAKYPGKVAFVFRQATSDLQ